MANGPGLNLALAQQAAVARTPFLLAMDKAEAARKRGQFADAVRHAEAAASVHPNDPAVLVLLGALHGELGEYERSEHYFRRTLEANPRCVRARGNLDKLRRLRAARGTV